MSGLLPPKRRRVEMNLLPLIDVLVMLIFFAFVTMQFRSVTALNLTLPEIRTAGENEIKDPLIISVDKEGTVTVNDKPADATQLAAIVREVAAISTDLPVLLKIDQDTPVKEMTRVMDACRAVGLNKIRLQSR
jgi:biopolymer transport protein ExbD